MFLLATKHLLPDVVFEGPIITKTFQAPGGVFDIKTAGVTIRIPPGAISSDTIATMSIKVCSRGPFQFPKDCKVISSICLFETNVKLVKPVEMLVSNFTKLLSEEDYHKITILKASLVPDYRGEAPFYSFRKVASAVFETGKTIGRFAVEWFGVFAAMGQVFETMETTGELSLPFQY